jgi:hypothetical protein
MAQINQAALESRLTLYNVNISASVFYEANSLQCVFFFPYLQSLVYLHPGMKPNSLFSNFSSIAKTALNLDVQLLNISQMSPPLITLN